MPRATLAWIALGWIGYAVLPWYGLNDSSYDIVAGLFGPAGSPSASGLSAGLKGIWWLLPFAIPLLAALVPVFRRGSIFARSLR